MKYNIRDLYFAKCRHCVRDIINAYYVGGEEIIPSPDYVDYYTIIYYHKGKFINLYDFNCLYKDIKQVSNPEKNYPEDIILEKASLVDYVREGQKRISRQDCKFVENIISKTLTLNDLSSYKR